MMTPRQKAEEIVDAHTEDNSDVGALRISKLTVDITTALQEIATETRLENRDGNGMKTPGQIAKEAYLAVMRAKETTDNEDAWEAAAQAVASEHDRRRLLSVPVEDR